MIKSHRRPSLPPLYVALVCALMSAAVVCLLVDRRRHASAVTRHSEDTDRALQQAADQLAHLRHQVECRTRRVQELEALVLRLSGRLELHDIDADDRQLLADIYHEYGTEGHAYYFGQADDSRTAPVN